MEPIYKPLSKEQKADLLNKGYKEYEYPYFPKSCDPDEPLCKLLII